MSDPGGGSHSCQHMASEETQYEPEDPIPRCLSFVVSSVTGRHSIL